MILCWICKRGLWLGWRVLSGLLLIKRGWVDFAISVWDDDNWWLWDDLHVGWTLKQVLVWKIKVFALVSSLESRSTLGEQKNISSWWICDENGYSMIVWVDYECKNQWWRFGVEIQFETWLILSVDSRPYTWELGNQIALFKVGIELIKVLRNHGLEGN